MSQIKVGSFVVSRLEPGLGRGKVFCAGYQYALVGFVDAKGQRILRRPQLGFVEPAEAPENQAPFDGWSVEADGECKPVPPSPPGAKAKARRGPKPPLVAEWTLEQAMQRFLAHYPEGMSSGRYPHAEREWKIVKHELWQQLLPGSTLRDLARSDPHEAGARLMKVVQTSKKPLLSQTGEIPVLNWALREGTPARYLTALADVLEHGQPERSRFEALIEALEGLPTREPGTKLLTWPVLTLVPFLAQPTTHMFLKPKPMKEAARRLGVDLMYDARPSWEVYERLLTWSHELLEFLKPHGAKDMIDVATFLWVVVQ